MQVFPQTTIGAVCQFPFTKTLQYRTIVNSVEDGSRIILDDPNASAIRWNLNLFRPNRTLSSRHTGRSSDQ